MTVRVPTAVAAAALPIVRRVFGRTRGRSHSSSRGRDSFSISDRGHHPSVHQTDFYLLWSRGSHRADAADTRVIRPSSRVIFLLLLLGYYCAAITIEFSYLSLFLSPMVYRAAKSCIPLIGCSLFVMLDSTRASPKTDDRRDSAPCRRRACAKTAGGGFLYRSYCCRLQCVEQYTYILLSSNVIWYLHYTQYITAHTDDTRVPYDIL